MYSQQVFQEQTHLREIRPDLKSRHYIIIAEMQSQKFVIIFVHLM